MATLPATLANAPRPAVSRSPRTGRTGDALASYMRGQAVANKRALILLRPFTDQEFGSGSEAPATAQIAEVNTLLSRATRIVARRVERLEQLAEQAARTRDPSAIEQALRAKQESNALIAAVERIRQFYWEIFGQRMTRIAPQLLASDRIALDCYQYVYGGLGKARSIPSPAPFSFMDAGLGPATFRRGVSMKKLGRMPNPFPLVRLPYSRLVTPWTLGAIPHEIGHNLQSDLGLWLEMPRQVNEQLRRAGIDPAVRRIWVRWTKETFADLVGVLLIGPAFVYSLMDVVGKSLPSTGAFNPRGVHPVPYYRVPISLHLLARIGFEEEAARIGALWNRLYPPAVARAVPAAFRDSFAKAMPLVASVMVERKFAQLGDKALRQVVAFRPQDAEVTIEAAQRLARGHDPGIVPERFLIGAARYAFDRRLTSPEVITRNFYNALGRR